MSDLRIDTQVLREGGSALRVVATEFQHANTRSDDAAAATGHPALADRVREFAHNWDDRRAKMLSNIAYLAEAASKVGEQFEELEDDFVRSLQGRG